MRASYPAVPLTADSLALLNQASPPADKTSRAASQVLDTSGILADSVKKKSMATPQQQQVTCEWTDCGQPFDNVGCFLQSLSRFAPVSHCKQAELLYNHLCQDHVGRKVQNNVC